MAEDDLVEFDTRGDASCLHAFLSRQAVCSAKQHYQQQEREAPHRLLHTSAAPPSSVMTSRRCMSDIGFSRLAGRSTALSICRRAAGKSLRQPWIVLNRGASRPSKCLQPDLGST